MDNVQVQNLVQDLEVVVFLSMAVLLALFIRANRNRFPVWLSVLLFLVVVVLVVLGGLAGLGVFKQ